MKDYVDLRVALHCLSKTNSMSLYKREVCKDAADAIEALQAEIAEKDKRIAELEAENERLMRAVKAAVEIIAMRISDSKCLLCKRRPKNERRCELDEEECLFEFIDENVAEQVPQVPNKSSCEGGEGVQK